MDQWIRKTDAADHMGEVTKSGVTYLTFPVLDATGIVTHAFSTRMGGVSEGWYSTMNFSFTRGDNREHVLENYSRMAAALGVDREKMVLTWQTHTTNIRVVSADDLGKGVVKDRDYRDIDGLLTNMPGVTLDIFCGLCPVIFCRSETPCHWSRTFRLARNREPHGGKDDTCDEAGIRNCPGRPDLLRGTEYLQRLL